MELKKLTDEQLLQKLEESENSDEILAELKGRKIKQVIVIRKDLKMRKGKIAAQASHASMKVFFDRGTVEEDKLTIQLTPSMAHWVMNSFAKVCVYVDSEEDLLGIYEQAIEENIPTAIIVDEGRTEFKGVPTRTAVAIGPEKSSIIDKITGGLPLY